MAGPVTKPTVAPDVIRGLASLPPPDAQIIAAFNRGMARAQVMACFGNHNPYAAPRRSPWLRDAWDAGFAWAAKRIAFAELAPR